VSEDLALTTYRLLGRSGLRVSPLALGTMTFGETWGAEREEAQRIFDAYVDLGGNFVDTANFYAQGKSEELVGDFAQAKRERLVLATKYSFATRQGDPNSGGNHRKSQGRGLEDSLRRLKTDYIDLLYLHVWDSTTPVDEVMRALDDVVRQGKAVYVGISDTPAWQVSRMQMLAELRGWSPFVALQVEYNLLQRTVERDLLPMAQEVGLGVLPWSPLASGLLSGKYGSKPVEGSSARRDSLAAHGRLTDRANALADVVRKVADRIGVTPAQVAIAWTLAHPAVTAPIIGARTQQQLQDNVAALGVTLDDAALTELGAASAIEPGFPHDFLAMDFIRHGLTGGTSVRSRA
jgi:aryl-alcohol dehydrogenase-like predicted oxidoreductase